MSNDSRCGEKDTGFNGSKRVHEHLEDVLPKNPFRCRKAFWINLRLVSGDYKTRFQLKQL